MWRVAFVVELKIVMGVLVTRASHSCTLCVDLFSDYEPSGGQRCTILVPRPPAPDYQRLAERFSGEPTISRLWEYSQYPYLYVTLYSAPDKLTGSLPQAG